MLLYPPTPDQQRNDINSFTKFMNMVSHFFALFMGIMIQGIILDYNLINLGLTAFGLSLIILLVTYIYLFSIADSSIEFTPWKHVYFVCFCAFAFWVNFITMIITLIYLQVHNNMSDSTKIIIIWLTNVSFFCFFNALEAIFNKCDIFCYFLNYRYGFLLPLILNRLTIRIMLQENRVHDNLSSSA